MAHKQPPATSPSRNTAATAVPAARPLVWALVSAALALAIAGMYLGLYRAKGFRLPVGFDAPWYVWRASFLAGHGLGPLGTSSRPGSAVLAAVLGSLTGRPQLTVSVLLAPVLAGCFALALGALSWSALGVCRPRWLASVVVGGTLLGGTRLVDENAATLLFLAIVVAALVPLIEASVGEGSRWSFVGSAVLLVAAGLAHWLFLAVFGAMLAGAVVLLAPSSLRRGRAEGVPLARTEAGTLASAGLVAGTTMAVAVFGLLRAPANTIQLKEDPDRFLPKLTNDASRLRLWLIGPMAALGAWALAGGGERPRPRRRVVIIALMIAWAAVAAAGIAFGAATKKVPPHRFLELLVVVPGVLAVAEGVAWVTRTVRGRLALGRSAVARRVAAVVAVVLSLALAVPGVVAWYASGAPKPWMNAEALNEARIVGAWAETLPSGRPFIVLVSPFGPAGTLSSALKERTIRAALSPDLQERFHLAPGSFVDVESVGVPNALSPAMKNAIAPYWRDVQPFLASRSPVLVMRAFAAADYAYLGARGARAVGSGVYLAHGPAPQRTLTPPAPSNAFPGVIGSALWAAAFLVLLWVAGIGWAMAILGRDASPPVAFGLAPAVGAAVLVLAGTAVSRAGAGLGGATAWIVWALTATAGGIAARLSRGAARGAAESKEALPS